MADDFFRSLGKSVAAQLAKNSRPTMDRELIRHLQGPMAYDQAPSGVPRKENADMPNMLNSRTKDLVSGFGPRGRNYDADPNDPNNDPNDPNSDPNDPNGPVKLSGSDCLVLIQRCLAGLADNPDEQDILVEGLQNILQGDSLDGSLQQRSQMPKYGDQGRAAPMSSGLDRGMRSGMRGGRDQQQSQRLPAQDSAITALNAKSFNARWGSLTANVRLDAMGR